MDQIKGFTKFFSEIGELCLQIHMVERPLRVFDFTTQEGQIINSDYFKSVKEKYPDVINGFYLAMRRTQIESMNFYLTKNYEVIVEYIDRDRSVIKITTYGSLSKAREDKPAFINFLTKNWNLF